MKHLVASIKASCTSGLPVASFVYKKKKKRKTGNNLHIPLFIRGVINHGMTIQRNGTNLKKEEVDSMSGKGKSFRIH